MSIHSYIRREHPPNSCNVNARHWLPAHAKHFLSNPMLNGSNNLVSTWLFMRLVATVFRWIHTFSRDLLPVLHIQTATQVRDSSVVRILVAYNDTAAATIIASLIASRPSQRQVRDDGPSDVVAAGVQRGPDRDRSTSYVSGARLLSSPPHTDGRAMLLKTGRGTKRARRRRPGLLDGVLRSRRGARPPTAQPRGRWPGNRNQGAGAALSAPVHPPSPSPFVRRLSGISFN